ncbi:galectin-8-like isoform X1 [Periophthalmus magnuspinnatus]|uniref:galectin-8-like isoform X1 n=1 Tax=Periophthalmus magnuspinnatus TaxID=409849 RepID=UPI00145BAF80|nr:galectin-8-like isoform X1 [Periophthalmus magnuspinnatus]
MSFSNPRQIFVNPVVPFSGTILGGLVPGEMLLIQGSVPSDVDRFQVDLLCGSSVKPRADVAFHFNPRVKKGCVVCNSLTRERWGREEIHKIMPFIPGDVFELVILVQSDVYKVAVNGAHLLEFKHRVELNRVDTLLIQGKVQIQAIAVLPNQSTVSSSEAQNIKSTESSSALCSNGELSVPFQAEIVKGLSPGRSITIKGRTSPNAQSLGVNLAVGGSSAIALHLNPRLKQRNFVRNSFLFDCWGPEETEIQDFPFEPDQYFEMIILCEASQFRVAVNGTHQFEYKHRVQDLSRVTVLTLTGDLSLEEVRLL